MLTLTILKNPFHTADREIYQEIHMPEKNIKQYFQSRTIGLEDFIYSANGKIVDAEFMPADGDYIAVCPVVGKGGFLGNILSMGLMMWTDGLAAKGLWGLAGGSVFAGIGAGAIAFVGGQLINHLFPPPTPEIPTYSASTPTYGWGKLSPTTTQGGVLARTYGTMRTAGTELAKHVTTDGDKQYLNVLLTGGQGPVDSITDIEINGNPIANYKDVVVETRLGTNDQTVIPNFNDTYADQPLSYELTSNWAAQRTDGNAMEGLEITIDLPGLCHMNDDGGLGYATVKIQAQLRKVDGGEWKDWPLQGAISAAKNTAVRRVYRMDGLPQGRYEVRVKCYEKSGTSTRDTTRVYWTQLSGIIYDDFCRPNKVLVGIKALATDQLSGSDITVTWKQSVENVNVYNPQTNQYELKSARNHAWASYDILHGCRKLKNIHTGQFEYVVSNVPANRIDYQAFSSWAQHCTSLGIEMEHVFDAASDLWTALKTPEVFGRGKVLMKGTKFSAVCDKPSTPVQLFTVGNMTQDKFSKDYLGLTDRANAIEISFINKEKGYQKDAITVYGDDWDYSDTLKNPTQITLNGCTSYQQAYQYGKYMLRVNKLLQRTCKWEADIDALACQIGDQVLLQHDVPEWGYGGRIESAAADTLTLDRTVSMIAGKTYSLIVRLGDDSLVTKAVVNTGTDTNILTVTTPFNAIPQQYDVFTFGEIKKEAKPFTIVDVDRLDDLTCSLTGIEYVPAVYEESLDAPVIQYSTLDTAPPEITNLVTKERTFRQKDGTIISQIMVSWNLSGRKTADKYEVRYSSDNGDSWTLGGLVSNNDAIINNVQTGATYLVKVLTIKAPAKSKGVISTPLLITGKDQPPSNILNIAAAINPSDMTKITLEWPAVTDIDLRGYRVMEGSTVLTPTPILDTRYTYTAISSRQHSFSVVAVDNSGNPSNIPAATTINIIIEPAQVAGFVVVIQETDRSRLTLSWTANSEQDISYYEIRTGDDWEQSKLIATQLKANTYTHVLTTEGSQNFMIKAVNVAGHASQQPALQRLQIILRPDAVINLAAVQEPRDRSMVKVTWTASLGKDIAGYELRYGNDWASGTLINTVKESTYWWYVPSSGTYNIMAQARTVAGYVSNIAAVSIVSMLEAYDVTGFTATQSISDRTKVTLVWETPISLDVSYFVIKKGISWDAGVVIGQRVTGTFYDVIVKDETPQTFWIKAVSVAGKYSQNPAKTSGIFNMNPSPVTNLQIQQNPNDKSIVNIMWKGVTESDLVGYQVKIGQVWESADDLPLTQELYCTYSPKQTGDIKVMIKTINAAGFYSDEVSQNYYCILEPLDVTGFQALQNGEYIEFYWNKSNEPDVIDYEIREGLSFGNSMLVASGITLNNHKIKVDNEKEYRYHIKAINKNNKYSNKATSASVSIQNLPPKNVIQTYDEIALQNGTKDDVEFGESLINWGNLGGKWSDYKTTKFSAIGGKTVLKLVKNGDKYFPYGQYSCSSKDLGEIITANISSQFVSTVLLRQNGYAKLQMRTSRDNVNWTEWQDFKPALYTFRYVDFRILLGTDDTTKTPEINQCLIAIDVPDREEVGTADVVTGTNNIIFKKKFHDSPIITLTAIGSNMNINVISKSLTGFTFTSNANGQLDWRARRY